MRDGEIRDILSAGLVPGEIMVMSVTRLGRAFVPAVGTAINEGDLLHIAVAASSIPQLKRILGI